MSKKLKKDTLNRIESYGNIEIRFKKGEIDEILMMDAKGECIFHLEEMYDGCISMVCYGLKKKIAFDLKSDAKIRSTMMWKLDQK